MLNEDEIKALTTISNMIRTYELNPTAAQGLKVLKELRDGNHRFALDMIISGQEWNQPTPTPTDIEYANKYRNILAITMRDCQPRG
jgi:hypothetical protein